MVFPRTTSISQRGLLAGCVDGADQRLAGVLMWIPLGALYTAAGIWATMTWIGKDD